MIADTLVAVIDDHEGVRYSLRALLESARFGVIDYPSAIAYLADGAQGGCIIADFWMPQMTGLELQRELSRRKTQAPLIMMTGHGDVSLAVSAMRAGAFDFLEKPADGERILDSVGRALAEGRKARLFAQEGKAAAELIANLTAREREVLDRLVLGMSNKLVARELSISPRTVEVHRARLQTKLKAHDLSYLVRLSIAAGQMI
ncbi:MAG TPA: response regulator [Rhizomicrobium sp.]|jgi:two-component system response regulator FixJ|nr:response regulator [Rhizomicrobium sp.]